MKDHTQEFTVVDIGTIHGLAQLIPEGNQGLIVNSRIALRTLNTVYEGIRIAEGISDKTLC